MHNNRHDNRDDDKPTMEIDPKVLKSGKPIFHKHDSRGTYEVVDWSVAKVDGLCRAVKVRRVERCDHPAGWYPVSELSLRDTRMSEPEPGEDE